MRCRNLQPPTGCWFFLFSITLSTHTPTTICGFKTPRSTYSLGLWVFFSHTHTFSIHPQKHMPGLVAERLESEVELAEGDMAALSSLSLSLLTSSSSSSSSPSSSSLWCREGGEAWLSWSCQEEADAGTAPPARASREERETCQCETFLSMMTWVCRLILLKHFQQEFWHQYRHLFKTKIPLN